ncbi:MAG: c-type cytochrome domain-containing protein [Fuerstiella sp.]
MPTIASMHQRSVFAGFTILWLIGGPCSLLRAQAPVEPLLQKYCLGCHNDNEPEAGLSLQTFESLKKGSDDGRVFDPQNPSASLLLKVLAPTGDSAMPPEGEPQPTDAERKRLRQWVLAGAKIAPMAAGRPQVPDIKPFGTTTPTLLASTLLSDGKTVIVGGGRHVAAIDTDSGEQTWQTTLSGSRVTSLAVAEAKPWLAAAVGMPGVAGRGLLLSTADGSVLAEFGGHTDAVYAAVLNSTDTVLATAGYDRRILLHDVATGDVLRTLEGHNGSVFSLAFDPTGTVLCSASADGTVKVWHVATGKRLDTLSQPQAEQYAVLVSRDGGRIFAAGADNRIRVWKLISTDAARINSLLISQFAHEQPITRLALSPDGTLLASVAEDRTLRLWNTSPFSARQSLPTQSAAVTSLTFIDNTRLFLTCIDGHHQILSIPAPDQTKPPEETMPDAAPVAVTLPDQFHEIQEGDVENHVKSPQAVALPAKISGVIAAPTQSGEDSDCFRFSAVAGQELVLELRAHGEKQDLDSRLEVLTADGQPIVRTMLQAVRDSYFTFRGKDSDTSDDFRVFNWQEMELNEYLYADGEVVKLWLYPRGPDSGFKVYPGFGKRFTYFGTTPTAHALQAPCFIVVPRRPEAKITPNGLPTFPVYYENDDDPRREFGRDSRLFFTAPADADYIVRVRDARGFGGPSYGYQLTVRPPQPDFEVTVSSRKISAAVGTGQEVMFTARRIDGYEGPIHVDIAELPPGWGFSGPVEIQEGQLTAFGTIYAVEGAQQPAADDLKKVRITASSAGPGDKDLGTLEELKLTQDPGLRVTIAAISETGSSEAEAVVQQTVGAEPWPVLSIRPGQTIRAMLRLERHQHKGIVSFGKEDSGRNLPHGVFVDNIGLNGLLLLSDQSEREFFITAAKWVSPSTSTFFLKSNVNGITSLPVTLRILPESEDSNRQVTVR